jgi:hypothetical protein
MKTRALGMLMVVSGWGGLLGGCTSYAPPALSVEGASVTERTPDGTAVAFALSAENSNDVALPLRTVEYTVTLDGREAFTGTRSAEATLRRKGVQRIVLPAVVTGAMELGGPTRYRLSGRVFYVTPGQLAEVLFDAGVRTPSAEFAFEGEVDLGVGASAGAVGGAGGN